MEYKNVKKYLKSKKIQMRTKIITTSDKFRTILFSMYRYEWTSVVFKLGII